MGIGIRLWRSDLPILSIRSVWAIESPSEARSSTMALIYPGLERSSIKSSISLRDSDLK